jgi:hypothetical protein
MSAEPGVSRRLPQAPQQEAVEGQVQEQFERRQRTPSREPHQQTIAARNLIST